MPRALPLLALSAFLVPLAACGGNPTPNTAAAQQRFGVRMAERGLWSEAWFRFEQARTLGGNDAELLNNLAVAAEALGRFDDALGFYRQALEIAPGNAELKGNYDRFVGFYESFRAQEEAAAPADAGAAAEPEEPPADYGEPSPAGVPPIGEPPPVAVEPPVPPPGAPGEPVPPPGDPVEPPVTDPDGASGAASIDGGAHHG